MGVGALEVFKFGIYVAIPVTLTFYVAQNPELLSSIIKNRAYVVYPPEGKRPPTAEEFDEIVKARQERLKRAAAKGQE